MVAVPGLIAKTYTWEVQTELRATIAHGRGIYIRVVHIYADGGAGVV